MPIKRVGRVKGSKPKQKLRKNATAKKLRNKIHKQLHPRVRTGLKVKER